MANIKINGLILRLNNFGDYHRYINILTEERGIISVFAKNIRKRKSKLNSVNQLFSYNEFELFYYKERYSLDAASPIYIFKNLSQDIYLLTAAAQIAEIIIDNAKEISDSPKMYALILRTFFELDRANKDPKTVTLASEIKLSSYLGYRPLLAHCYYCDDRLIDSQEVYFDFRNACLYCPKHYQKMKDQPLTNIRRISQSLLQTIRYIVYADLEDTFSFEVSNSLQSELAAFTKLYLIEHFEKNYDKLSSLDQFKF